MPQASRTFRIFVSSPFSDQAEERNALQDNVFPGLKDLCEKHDCRFQAIDLRWGVSSESARDQKTMRLCLEEVRRCQEITPKPNFIVLLGDRYGYRPLPEVIPRDEFEQVRDQVQNDGDKGLLNAWYELDENAVPHAYFLKPRIQDPPEGAGTDEIVGTVEKELARYRPEEKTLDAVRTAARGGNLDKLLRAEEDAWSQTEKELLRIVRSAVETVELNDEQRRKYFTSATEQEIERGVMKVDNAEDYVFCFFRTITDFHDKATEKYDASVKDYLDIQLEDDKATEGPLDKIPNSMLLDLRERLKNKLNDNVIEYKARWKGFEPNAGDGEKEGSKSPITTDHLDKLCKDVTASLSRVIEQQIAETIHADKTGAADTVEMEVETQEEFGKDRAEYFTGRTTELGAVSEYIGGSEPHAFAVFGEGGSGKSAFMAQAFEDARKGAGETVIFRSIGATPSSSDIRSLLDGICRQITRAYQGDENTVPSSYEDLVKDFKERMALAEDGRRLIIFLDALDQLSEANNAKGLVWLPDSLPENVRMIVSMRPGQELEAIKRKIPEKNLLLLGAMSRTEGESLLKKWLGSVDRTLQDFQMKHVISAFETSGGKPLYLMMAFQEARNWISSTKGDDIELGESVKEMIRNLFERLEDPRNHGKVLTTHALGYMAASRHGLSEDEFIDILSKAADPAVLEEFLRRSPHSPQHIDAFPIAPWSRFFLDLEPYLTERMSENVKLFDFYHRELGDTAKEMFLDGDEAKARHRVLAEHFNKKGHSKGKGYWADKVDERKRWEGSSRALSELPYHVTKAGLWDELFSTLTDFEFLENKAARVRISEFAGEGDETEKLYGGVFELQKDYELALEEFPTE